MLPTTVIDAAQPNGISLSDLPLEHQEGVTLPLPGPAGGSSGDMDMGGHEDRH